MKTGADACTACVRLARVYTGRNHILTSGYHGFHDWFVANENDSGVPKILSEYIHEIEYDDIEAVDRVFDNAGDRIAAAIIEPCEFTSGKANKSFLQKLRKKCDEYGVLLIFDEVLTGFRLALGGAQQYFDITPDLAAFAKAIANGYPFAAFSGKEKYMQPVNDTFITTTYGGEILSLTACIATMTIMHNEPVHNHIFEMGQRLQKGFAEVIT